MFGDFGSGHRHRIPRDQSPFDTFGRSHRAGFSERDWDTPQMHRTAGTGNGPSSEPNRSSGVERIIPIRVVGSPSPPPAGFPQQQQPQKEPSNAESTTGRASSPAPPIILGWPTDTHHNPDAMNRQDTVDRKYSNQRHNTTDNLQVNPPAPGSQRAKSEPPNTNTWTTGTNTTTGGAAPQPASNHPPFQHPPQHPTQFQHPQQHPTQFQHPQQHPTQFQHTQQHPTPFQHPQQHPTSSQSPTHHPANDGGPAGMQFGGNKSKVRNGEGTTGAGYRNIPITVERGPTGGGFGGMFSRKNQTAPSPHPQPQPSTTTPAPQKTRPQPDHHELITPPPPPKKVTKDSMQIIQEIIEEVKGLEAEVNSLPFTPKNDKKYIYLDEMLTRNLIKLDTIETEGREDIRQFRRDCIKLIQKVISVLEEKSQESVVPFGNPPAGSQSSSADDAVSIQLALTPTTSVTTPEVVVAETAMDVSSPVTSVEAQSSDTVHDVSEPEVTTNSDGGEPMVVDKIATTATA